MTIIGLNLNKIFKILNLAFGLMSREKKENPCMYYIYEAIILSPPSDLREKTKFIQLKNIFFAAIINIDL